MNIIISCLVICFLWIHINKIPQIIINWKIIARENLENFLLSSIHLRKQTPNEIPKQFYSKSSLKTFSPFQKSITFSFFLNEEACGSREISYEKFSERRRERFDEFAARTTKQEREGGVRWPRGTRWK